MSRQHERMKRKKLASHADRRLMESIAHEVFCRVGIELQCVVFKHLPWQNNSR